MRTILLWILGISFGLMVSAGVFTVLFVVGLVPRFAGRTNTAKYEIFYEECLIAGAVLGGLLSAFPLEGCSLYAGAAGIVLLAVIGVFSGIFVGCLSIALAEVLDGLPIFARRVKLKKGVTVAVASIALGKAAGSFVYFAAGFFNGV